MFDRMPLRWRLTLLITSICAITLLAAFGGYLAVELLKIRQSVTDRMESTMRLLVANATSILERDPTATNFPLSTLQSDPTVVAAAVTMTRAATLPARSRQRRGSAATRRRISPLL